jgi:hypothetical protein
MLGGATTTVGSGSAFGTITSAFFFVGVRYPNICIIFAAVKTLLLSTVNKPSGFASSPPQSHRLQQMPKD